MKICVAEMCYKICQKIFMNTYTIKMHILKIYILITLEIF